MSKPEVRSVTLLYVPSKPCKTVTLVGEFNHWNRSKLPLTKRGKQWSITFDLAPGVYAYQFCEDGERWVCDPKGIPHKDLNGNDQTLLVVTPACFEGHAGRLGDGDITIDAIHHPSGYLGLMRMNESTFAFKLTTRANDVQQTSVVVSTNGKIMRVPMERVPQNRIYDSWTARLGNLNGKFSYHFELEDGPTVARYPLAAEFQGNPNEFPLPKIPRWVPGTVFYQIFPERFANGNPQNDPPGTVPWTSTKNYRDWYGGDLPGIRQHLAHLFDLGVSGLYLCPIFRAESYHMYDTTDYHTVDYRLGTNDDLKGLVEDCHRGNIKVMLDAVFNHSSPHFAPFADVVKNGDRSSYKDWFFIKSYPVNVVRGAPNYDTFAGNFGMPKLNQDNPATRDFFLDVSTHWIKEAGIDAWRLDVANEVSHDFWKRFHTAVRKANPETFIVGEIWTPAQEWMQGDEHDSQMNYPWRDLVLKFFGDGALKPSEFQHGLRLVREMYPDATVDAMFNMLGSHDTPRLRNLLKHDIKKERAAVAFQMCYPGVPSIYYGDEVGMDGGHDPECRKPMDWTKKSWDKDLLKFYKDILALRRKFPVISSGAYQDLECDDAASQFSFQRTLGDHVFRAVFNRGVAPISVTLGPGEKIIYGPSKLAPMEFAWIIK